MSSFPARSSTTSPDGARYASSTHTPLESVKELEYPEDRQPSSQASDADRNSQTEPFPSLPMTPPTADYYITPESEHNTQQSQGENPDHTSFGQSCGRDELD